MLEGSGRVSPATAGRRAGPPRAPAREGSSWPRPGARRRASLRFRRAGCRACAPCRHRLAPRRLDSTDRLARHLRLLAEDALGGAGLDDDDVERVTHGVVQLACEAGALQRDGLVRASVAVGGEEHRPLALGALDAASVDADHDRHHPHHRQRCPRAEGGLPREGGQRGRRTITIPTATTNPATMARFHWSNATVANEATITAHTAACVNSYAAIACPHSRRGATPTRLGERRPPEGPPARGRWPPWSAMSAGPSSLYTHRLRFATRGGARTSPAAVKTRARRHADGHGIEQRRAPARRQERPPPALRGCRLGVPRPGV